MISLTVKTKNRKLRKLPGANRLPENVSENCDFSNLTLGITLVILSLFGKIPREIHLFTILASGKAITSSAVV